MGIRMRDRNPALSSKLCPICSKFGLRQYISFKFIQHYGVYCTECGHKTEPSPSEMMGTKEWREAEELKESAIERIIRINQKMGNIS